MSCKTYHWIGNVLRCQLSRYPRRQCRCHFPPRLCARSLEIKSTSDIPMSVFIWSSSSSAHHLSPSCPLQTERSLRVALSSLRIGLAPPGQWWDRYGFPVVALSMPCWSSYSSSTPTIRPYRRRVYARDAPVGNSGRGGSWVGVGVEGRDAAASKVGKLRYWSVERSGVRSPLQSSVWISALGRW